MRRPLLRWCWRATALIGIAALMIVSTGDAGVLCAQEPCPERVPSGFRTLGSTFRGPWDHPWAFSGSPARSSALPMLDYFADKSSRPLKVRLDDGSTGELRVQVKVCAPGDDCAPYDCGCIDPAESFWIEIRRANGTLVARKHLWAAYRVFQIVAADLIDGPGDELLVTRIPAHASPPIGWDLKIWQIGSHITEVGELDPLQGSLPSIPFTCARWLTSLTIDPSDRKPRPIALTADFAVPGTECCQLNTGETGRVANMKRAHALRFNASSRRYVLTGPAPRAFSRSDQ